MAIKQQLTEDMKAAMKGGDKARLGVIRLLLAAIKQVEVDERIELDDTRVLAIIEKQVKQRRESVKQYGDAGRDDLVGQEQAEIEVISAYLPEPLSEDDLKALIDELIAATGASSVRDMGKVMGQLKARAQGRVDMGTAGALIKQRLA